MQSSDYTVKVRGTSHNVTTNIVSVQHSLTDLGGCLLVTWIVTPAGAWGVFRPRGIVACVWPFGRGDRPTTGLGVRNMSSKRTRPGSFPSTLAVLWLEGWLLP